MLVNPAVHTERKDRHLLPVLRHVVKAFPGIINDIKKPGPGRGRLRQDAAAVRLLPAAGLGRDPGRHRAPSPAPLLLLHSRDDHVVEPSNAAWILANVASDGRHRGVARGQLPRGHARQRRRADLRPRASSSCTGSRPRPPARDTGAMTTPTGRDNGLPPAARYVALVDVDPPVADHVLELLRDAGVTAVAEPLAGRPRARPRETPPPTRPTDRVHVDHGHLLLARAVVGRALPALRGRLPRRRRPAQRRRGGASAERRTPRRARRRTRSTRSSPTSSPASPSRAADPVPRWSVLEDAPATPRRSGRARVPPARCRRASSAAAPTRSRRAVPDEDPEGHFVPEPPPPLPPRPTASPGWPGRRSSAARR